MLTDLERMSGKLKANKEYRLLTEADWEFMCRDVCSHGGNEAIAATFGA